MRAEGAVLAMGAAVAVLILAAHAMLLPDPPERPAVPGIEALEALGPYLAADAAGLTGADPGSPVRLARDPFTAGGWSVAAAPGVAEPRRSTGSGWSVSAIMISDNRRLAIVDDRLVEPGDTLPGGTRVVEVARDHVLLVGADGVRRRVALNR